MIDFLKQFEGRKAGFSKSTRESAVMVLFTIKDNTPYLILEERSHEMRTQPGEISFPGGRIDKGETPTEAALRETKEELGIDPDKITIIGELDYYITHFEMVLHPILGIYLGELDFKDINPLEVHKVHLIDFNYFLETEPTKHGATVGVHPDENFPIDPYDWRKLSYSINFYQTENILIWGMTANMIKALVDIIKEEPYETK